MQNQPLQTSLLIICLALATAQIPAQNAKPEPASATKFDTPLPIVRLSYDITDLPLPSTVTTLGNPICGFHDNRIGDTHITPNRGGEEGLVIVTPDNQVHNAVLQQPTEKYSFNRLVSLDADDQNAYLLNQKFVVPKHTASAASSPVDDKPVQTFTILKYSSDGQLQDTISLDERFYPTRFGVFPNGDFLILGFDTVNAIPTLSILKPDGDLRSIVDIHDVFPSNDALKGTTWKGFAKMDDDTKLRASIGIFRINHTPRGLALTQQGGSGKIILIRSSGEVTTVTPQLPEGFLPGTFISSEKSWLIRVEGKTWDQVKFRIFEFNPDDGSLIREIDTDPIPANNISCEQDGDFRSYTYKTDEKKFYLTTGRLQ